MNRFKVQVLILGLKMTHFPILGIIRIFCKIQNSFKCLYIGSFSEKSNERFREKRPLHHFWYGTNFLRVCLFYGSIERLLRTNKSEENNKPILKNRY